MNNRTRATCLCLAVALTACNGGAGNERPEASPGPTLPPQPQEPVSPFTYRPCSDYAEATPPSAARSALPGVALVQVIHVTGPEAVDEALSVADQVDALLLDSGDPRLRVRELGGTGRTHDWRLSAAIREAVPVPVFLAGGLRPENVRAAIAEVGPWGLDLCSGVRTGGRLDPAKLQRFMAETRTFPS